MKFITTAQVIGARYYDIPDEKTGEIRRFTSVFTVQQSQANPDRCGFEAGKLSGDNSDLVKQLAAIKLPSEVQMEVEINPNAKGQARPRVLRIIGPAAKAPA
ncbi:MAG: hypothetical protein ACT4QA_07050 [Panacagrimonas sp.]